MQCYEKISYANDYNHGEGKENLDARQGSVKVLDIVGVYLHEGSHFYEYIADNLVSIPRLHAFSEIFKKLEIRGYDNLNCGENGADFIV